ncbi:MAG TPA: ATP-binding cassette domain-containing protein, partial [Ktedonobacterales bacterium]|nr:ATP-binding cassette domain-containing protein [Ktedonobacterales bacterium]
MAVRSTREHDQNRDPRERPGAAVPHPPARSGLEGSARRAGRPKDKNTTQALGRLEVILHDAQGGERMIFPLTAARTTIGRDPTNNIVIDSPVVPPVFADIEQRDGEQPRMITRDGVTALYYRGQPVKEQALADGAILRAGDPNGSLVTFVYDETSEGAPKEHTPYGRHATLAPGAMLTIGRDPSNQLVLDGEDVAPHHAYVTADPAGQVTITNLLHTSGTFVNGARVQRARLTPGVEVRIGSHRLVFTGTELLQYGETDNVRIDAIDLTQSVRAGGIGPLDGHDKLLLDHVSLTILPGTFVAIVGASGSGKTTLLGALNGQRPMKSGMVLYNGENFYEHEGDFNTSLGYVPQDDIVHKNLTVEKALFYAARLRLPKGTTRSEIKQRITDVLDAIDMLPQRKQLISKLSGGQRKRVNIALELLARPSIFYLDEPTSGLDPGLDRKMMQLLRRLADRGHTVVLATHATTNINIADYVCFLAPGGLLAFFGTPTELMRHFGKTDYAEIYNEL